MANTPAWLPPITCATGVWETDLPNLYAIYSDYFIDSDCFLDEAKVFPQRSILDGEYQEGFWHLITKNFADAEHRLVEPRRAERLCWSRPLIENCLDSANVMKWSAVHTTGKVRTYLWLAKQDYVLILQPLKNGKATQLITAYYVEGDSTRRKLIRSWESRLEK